MKKKKSHLLDETHGESASSHIDHETHPYAASSHTVGETHKLPASYDILHLATTAYYDYQQVRLWQKKEEEFEKECEKKVKGS